jgi:hypothetical protein
MSDKNKKIKVVQGDGKIDISPVSSHLEIEKPKTKKNSEKIIIPKEKKNK